MHFDTGNPAMQFVEHKPWLERMEYLVFSRGRWFKPCVDIFDSPIGFPGLFGFLGNRKKGQRIFYFLSVVDDRHAGDFFGAGFGFILYFLGSSAYSYVFSYWDMGRPAAGIRGHQILSVYLGRFCIDADRDFIAFISFPNRIHLISWS